MKILAVAAFVLFSLASRVSSAEEPAPPPPEPPGLAAFEAEMMPPAQASAAPAHDAARPEKVHPRTAEARPPLAEAPAVIESREDLSPQPDVGWRRGKRAPVYFNVMLLGEGFGEDPHYRLTTRSSRVLEGGGGLVRLGGVLGLHHRVGLRMQSFMRPTKKVLGSTTADEWGMVAFGYFGPEYLYTTDAGIYFGGSIGVAGAMSQDRLDCHHECDCGTSDGCGMEKGNVGGAAMVSLGYELRASKWFALNVEAFGGVYRGIDDDEKAMNGSVFGLGVGVGF